MEITKEIVNCKVRNVKNATHLYIFKTPDPAETTSVFRIDPPYEKMKINEDGSVWHKASKRYIPVEEFMQTLSEFTVGAYCELWRQKKTTVITLNRNRMFGMLLNKLFHKKVDGEIWSPFSQVRNPEVYDATEWIILRLKQEESDKKALEEALLKVYTE